MIIVHLTKILMGHHFKRITHRTKLHFTWKVICVQYIFPQQFYTHSRHIDSHNYIRKWSLTTTTTMEDKIRILHVNVARLNQPPILRIYKTCCTFLLMVHYPDNECLKILFHSELEWHLVFYLSLFPNIIDS